MTDGADPQGSQGIFANGAYWTVGMNGAAGRDEEKLCMCGEGSGAGEPL
jgi:hypothetical protein